MANIKRQQRHRILRRTGDATRFRTFPIRRERPEGRTEYQVYLGFESQSDAESWVDNAITCGHLITATQVGSPGRPGRIREPVRAD